MRCAAAWKPASARHAVERVLLRSRDAQLRSAAPAARQAEPLTILSGLDCLRAGSAYPVMQPPGPVDADRRWIDVADIGRRRNRIRWQIAVVAAVIAQVIGRDDVTRDHADAVAGAPDTPRSIGTCWIEYCGEQSASRNRGKDLLHRSLHGRCLAWLRRRAGALARNGARFCATWFPASSAPQSITTQSHRERAEEFAPQRLLTHRHQPMPHSLHRSSSAFLSRSAAAA
jgi:hypothetical protein